MDKRALRILLDHNLPFILWSAAAVAKALWSTRADGYVCPVRFFLKGCLGCDLTGAYADLLKTGRAPAWLFVILGLFVLNFVISLFRARRLGSI